MKNSYTIVEMIEHTSERTAMFKKRCEYLERQIAREQLVSRIMLLICSGMLSITALLIAIGYIKL